MPFCTDCGIMIHLPFSIISSKLPHHLWMSNMILFIVVLPFNFLASLLWHIFSAVVGGHLWLLPFCFLCSHAVWNVCCPVYCINVYFHSWCFIIHHLCFLCGFLLIASLLWTDLVQICILFLLCIVEFCEVCIVFFEIMWLHFWRLLLGVWGLLL